MITPRQILRHARAERFAVLLDAVLGNGRSCPLTLRLHLEQDADWTLASLALGAMRTLELTFPISFEAGEMLDRLADALRGRGIGGPVPVREVPNPRPVSPGALAACAAALASAVREADGLPKTEAHATLVARLRAALDDAGAGLARWQWTGSTSVEPTLWSAGASGQDRIEDAAASMDPIEVAAVLWLARDHCHDIPHADIPALTSMAEAMGLTHDRVLGPVVRSAL